MEGPYCCARRRGGTQASYETTPAQHWFSWMFHSSHSFCDTLYESPQRARRQMQICPPQVVRLNRKHGCDANPSCIRSDSLGGPVRQVELDLGDIATARLSI